MLVRPQGNTKCNHNVCLFVYKKTQSTFNHIIIKHQHLLVPVAKM